MHEKQKPVNFSCPVLVFIFNTINGQEKKPLPPEERATKRTGWIKTPELPGMKYLAT